MMSRNYRDSWVVNNLRYKQYKYLKYLFFCGKLWVENCLLIQVIWRRALKIWQSAYLVIFIFKHKGFIKIEVIKILFLNVWFRTELEGLVSSAIEDFKGNRRSRYCKKVKKKSFKCLLFLRNKIHCYWIKVKSNSNVGHYWTS